MAKTKRSRKRAKQKKGSASKKALPPKSQSEQEEQSGLFSFDWNDETYYRLVYFSPFFNGAFLGSGLVLDRLILFSVVLGVITAAFYCGLNVEGERQKVRLTNKFALLYIIQIVLCFLFFTLSQDAPAALMLALCALCMLLHQSLAIETPRQVLLAAFALTVEMGLFMLLGVRSQLDYTLWSSFWLGIGPGTILSAYYVLQHLSVLEDHGWLRHKIVKTKKDVEVFRPQGSSRVYALLLMSGVVAVVGAATFAAIPNLFAVLGLLLLPMPQLAEGFLKENKPLEIIKTQTLYLALAAAGSIFLLAQIYR